MNLEIKETHNFFALIAIIVGILLVVITPPMGTPDENAHFMNAYSISCGDVFPELVDGQVGRYVPAAIINFTNEYNGKLSGKLDEKYSFSDFYFDSWLTGESMDPVFYATSLTTINPIGYIFSSMGMAIGSILTKIFFNSTYILPYNLLLFSRISNLIFYIFCCYMAIKITPYFKRTMMMVALMPSAIYAGASVSYDAVLIPVSMILFAVALKILCSEEDYIVNKEDAFFVMFCTFILTGIKLAYLPFIILVLAIPIKKFGSFKKYIFLVLATLCVFIITFFIPKILLNQAIDWYKFPVAENEILQQEYIFSNIWMFPKIIWNTIRNSKIFYLNGFFGNLGQLDINFPVPFVVLFYVILFLTAVVEASIIIGINLRARILPIISFFISIIGMFYMTYIGWTSLDWVAGVGADTVSGIQGRYFIPMFIFICLPIANTLLNKVKMKSVILDIINMKSKLAVLCYSSLTILMVYSRYW